MLRNDATHFNGKFNQKDVARQIIVRFFVPVARFFLVSGLGVSVFGKCIKRNKSRHHDASYFLLTLLYY